MKTETKRPNLREEYPEQTMTPRLYIRSDDGVLNCVWSDQQVKILKRKIKSLQQSLRTNTSKLHNLENTYWLLLGLDDKQLIAYFELERDPYKTITF